jgi:hypothetical protein
LGKRFCVDKKLSDAFFRLGGWTPTFGYILSPARTIDASVGTEIRLEIGFSMHPQPTIQWYKNGESIPGATTKTLTLSNIGKDDIGNYNIQLTNKVETITSERIAVNLKN